ncbi:MAG TPA: DUF389 domain-containing protein [Labilithrix sp.]|nr:DUF389 domain-containing protein [Labilithrix sp.]
MRQLSALFGITAATRTTVVREMLERHVVDRPAYWLALGLSACIATLGLVLDSPGVVIGAMLISPLMGPIVELGMGLAIGSPLLVVRAFTRSLTSVVFVAGVAALITLVLPYHELTRELAARTSPTVLDLCVAVCCAVAAVYATVQSSKAAGVASGTAIGIALVPPICVGGYGVGSGNAGVAAGAMLLFVANFSAIVLVAVVSFLALRFDKVDVHALEGARIEAAERTSRASRWLHVVLGSRYGRLLRVLMPLAMAGAVFVPLRSAMQELSWEIRVRASVAALLRTSPATRSAIRSSLKVDHDAVSLEVAIVGSAEDGARLEQLLTAQLREVAGLEPSVVVMAVAGAANIQRLESSFARAQPIAVPRRPTIGDVRRSLGMALEQVWPGGALGPLLDWRLRVPAEGDPVVELFHLGEPLGDSGERLLAIALVAKLDAPLRVRDVAYSTRPTTADRRAPTAWIPALREALEASRDHPLFACVAVPTSFGADAGTADPASAEVASLLGAARADHLAVRRAGKDWSVVLSAGRCADVADGGADDGGADDGGDGGAADGGDAAR